MHLPKSTLFRGLFIGSILLLSFLLISTIFSAAFQTNEAPLRKTRGTDPALAFQNELQSSQASDGSWGDVTTTALSMYSLLRSGVNASSVWSNDENTTVSIGNSSVPNTLLWINTSTPVPLTLGAASFEPNWGEIGIQDISTLATLVLSYSELELENETETLRQKLLLYQDADGSWNGDVSDTSFAIYALSWSGGLNSTIGEPAKIWLNTSRSDSGWDWGNVVPTAQAILAFRLMNESMAPEITALIGQQAGNGSFGDVTASSWAVLAMIGHPTTEAKNASVKAVEWLQGQPVDQFSTEELAITNLAVTEFIRSSPQSNDTDSDDEPHSDIDTEYNGGTPPVPGGANGTDRTEGGTAKDLWDADIIWPVYPATDEEPLDDGNGKQGEAPGDNDDLQPSGSDGTGNRQSLDVDPDSASEPQNLLRVLIDNPVFIGIIVIICLVIIITVVVTGVVAKYEEKSALDGIRRDMYEYIKFNPGEHLSSIMHEFDLSPSSITYHLKVLEDTNRVVHHKDSKYKRYYINGDQYRTYTNGKSYSHLLAPLKNPTARRIVTFILDHPNSSQKEVAECLGLHPSSVNWHAKRLAEAGILYKAREGKEISYFIKQEDIVRNVIAIAERKT